MVNLGISDDTEQDSISKNWRNTAAKNEAIINFLF